MPIPLLAGVTVIGLGAPPPQSTLLRLEVGAESAVTNVSGSWLWNPRGDAVLVDEGDAHVRGIDFRLLLGTSRVYLGAELGVSQVTRAPALSNGHRLPEGGAFFRTTTPPSGTASSGSSVTLAAPFGLQGQLGPVLVGVEALIGWRVMSLEAYEDGPTVDGFVPLFETRARAGVWLTPTVSLTLVAGKGVVVNDSRSLCLSVSVSKLPFDGER